jgi:D-alanyl-D-alanine carboxypeptidase (penicillin-binding protein 5/6)
MGCVDVTARAEQGPQTIPLTAQAAVLIERSTGKTLYGKDENRGMYPASMTKIMTAMIALDYIKPEEFIVLGEELRQAPVGSSVAYHKVGETILFENLLRGLLIQSGNESACAIALNVAKRSKNVEDMDYDEAEKVFCDLMNNKAASLGAKNTHFANPHGFHEENHYSSARDIALFCREFMNNPLLSEIVSEKSFIGSGAGINYPEGSLTQEYNWESHNNLIKDGDEYYYSYANGIKTGFTSEAGNCLAASAQKDKIQLISVVFNSPEPGHWNDTKALFEYGFNNYGFRVIQSGKTFLEELVIDNPRLGEDKTLEVFSAKEFTQFLSDDEFSRIVRKITYNPDLLADNPDEELIADVTIIKPPIDMNQLLGTVTYSLDNTVLFEDDIVSTKDVLVRTRQSDIIYYWKSFKSTAFTEKYLPYWIGGAALVVGFIILMITLSVRRRRRSNSFSRYHFRSTL